MPDERVDLPYDIEPETDDHEAVDVYAAEVKRAVEEFNIPVFTPPANRPAPQDLPRLPRTGKF